MRRSAPGRHRAAAASGEAGLSLAPRRGRSWPGAGTELRLAERGYTRQVPGTRPGRAESTAPFMSDAITNASPAPAAPLDFIRQIVTEDLKAGRHGGRVHTRFPPEPNGYLHIGHAKSICLNFGVAAEFGGQCNLRLDDTNPTKEDVEYVDSIRTDVRWLGFDWDDARVLRVGLLRADLRVRGRR